jgi:hypothetical protein
MSATFNPFLGKGQFSIQKYTETNNFRWVGNVTDVKKKTTEKVIKLPSGSTGGTYASVSIVELVQLEIHFRDFNVENLALGLRGTASEIATGSIVNEAHVAHLGKIVRLANIAPTVVVVTNVAGTTTYVSGTDYEVRPGGLLIIETGTIVEASTIHVDYTYPKHNIIEALTESGAFYKALFEGNNQGNEGKEIVVDFWKCQFGLAAEIGLITNEFGDLVILADVLEDSSKFGTGISKYYKISQV